MRVKKWNSLLYHYNIKMANYQLLEQNFYYITLESIKLQNIRPNAWAKVRVRNGVRSQGYLAKGRSKGQG